MKTFFTILLIFFSVCRPASATLIELDSKIAIMDLGTHEGAVPIDINIFNAGQAASEYLIQRLVQVGKFNIMDRNLANDKISVANLNTTGLIDPDTAKKIGEILGVEYLVYGNVNDVTLSENAMNSSGVGLDISTITVKAHIIVRVMEIETGKILSASKGEGKSKGSFVRIKGGPVAEIAVGRTKVTQDSVHNALQQAAFQTVDVLVKRLLM